MTEQEKREFEKEITASIATTIKDCFNAFRNSDVPFPACALEMRRREEIEKQIKELAEDVYGNGKDGIKISQVKQGLDIQTLKEFMNDTKNLYRWLLLLVFATLITSVLQLILK